MYKRYIYKIVFSDNTNRYAMTYGDAVEIIMRELYIVDKCESAVLYEYGEPIEKYDRK